MPVREIAPSEREALRTVLNAEGLPTVDLDAPGRTFFRWDRPDGMAGYGGLEIYGVEALLRSVVVLPTARGLGLGREIAHDLIAHARSSGIERLWLLTTTAADFFSRVGFQKTDRSSAPPAIAATTEFASLCPATAVFMTLKLN